MFLYQITDEKDLKDGRTYLCCRESSKGNAIWETLESHKHRLLYSGNLRMPISSFAKVFDLPKTMEDIEVANDTTS